jgi:hypothetical protein
VWSGFQIIRSCCDARCLLRNVPIPVSDRFAVNHMALSDGGTEYTVHKLKLG